MAQWINLGTELLEPWGWRLSLALAGLPAIVLTLGGIFLQKPRIAWSSEDWYVCYTQAALNSYCTNFIVSALSTKTEGIL